MRAAAVVGVLLVLASCKGADGAAGTDGAPGAAGTSVTITSLAVGNANCPYGGTQFTVGTTVSYACSGAPGFPGAYVYRDATGALVGPAFGDLGDGLWIDSTGYAWAFDAIGWTAATERWTLHGALLASCFAEPGCTGTAYVEASNLFPRLTVEVASGSGSTYFVVPASSLPAPAAVTCQSSWWSDSGSCSNSTYTMDGCISTAALTAVSKPAFPFTAPFHLARE